MLQQAYQNARRIGERPRAVEHRLMTEITGEMISARAAGIRGVGLMPALHRNREAWGVFSAVCGAPGNLLPAAVRAGMISLAIWVEKHTSDVIAGRETIDSLIEVNMAIIDGLSANGADAAAAI